MRLIDADALELVPDYRNAMNGVRFCGRGGGRTVAMVQAALKQMIDNAPTIDAVPVVHGYWLYGDEYAGHHDVDCSVCGDYARTYYDYCPNCGAKMDAKEEQQ